MWINKPGIGYTLIAKSGTASIESDPIDIYQPDEVIFILFVSQTRYGTGGFGIGTIWLQLLNGQGGVIRSSTDEVNISLGNNPGNATLQGTTSLNAIDGEVRFEDLVISEPGIGYTLIATSGNGIGESRPIDLRPSDCPAAEGGSIFSNPVDFTSAKINEQKSHLTWTIQLSGTNQTLNAIWGSSSSDIFVVGNEGTILHYDGSNWNPQNSGTENPLYSVWGSGPSDVFAGGSRGTILHYDGTKWTQQDSDELEQAVDDLWGSSSNNVFAASHGTNDHRISHFDGTGWEQQSIFYCGVTTVSGSSDNNVYNGGVDGLIMKYDGTDWTRQPVNTLADINSLFVVSTSNAVAVAESGVIIHFDGSDWIRQESGINTELFDVSGSFNSEFYAVGFAGRILYYDGVNWSTEFVTDNMEKLNGVYVTSPNDVFIVGDNGFVIRGN